MGWEMGWERMERGGEKGEGRGGDGGEGRRGRGGEEREMGWDGRGWREAGEGRGGRGVEEREGWGGEGGAGRMRGGEASVY